MMVTDRYNRCLKTAPTKIMLLFASIRVVCVAYMDVGKGREQDAEAFIRVFFCF